MGAMIDKKYYGTNITYSTYPELQGEIIIKSNNFEFNKYVEDVLTKMLNDMYYGQIDDFEL